MSYLIFSWEAFIFYINPFLSAARRKIFLFDINTSQAFERVRLISSTAAEKEFSSDRLLYIENLLRYEMLRKSLLLKDIDCFLGTRKLRKKNYLDKSIAKSFAKQELVFTILKMLKILEMAKEYEINHLSKDVEYFSEFIRLIEEVEASPNGIARVSSMFKNLKELLLKQKFILVQHSMIDLIGIRFNEYLTGAINKEELMEFLINNPSDLNNRLRLEGLGELHQKLIERNRAKNKGITIAENVQNLLNFGVVSKSGELNENWLEILKDLVTRSLLSTNEDPHID
jgi:hypothetical protein